MKLNAASVEALASLTRSHATLVNSLGKDHPAAKAVEEQIRLLTEATEPQQAPEEGPCTCGGCRLVRWLVTGQGGEDEGYDAYKSIWLEAEGDIRKFHFYLTSAMAEAKRVGLDDSTNNIDRLAMAMRGVFMLVATQRLRVEFPELAEAEKALEAQEQAKARDDIIDLGEGRQARVIEVSSPAELQEVLGKLGIDLNEKRTLH